MSPLERYPIVSQVAGSKFVIPNVRTYLRSFEDVIHFTLLDRLGNEYTEYRGYAQELYLLELLRAKLPKIAVVEERVYRKKKRELRGPDALILDTSEHSMVAIESKGRRVTAETRSVLSEAAMDRNCTDAYSALKKLPSKIHDLKTRLLEYTDFQAEIDLAMGQDPVCVVVLGDAVFFMSEMIRYRSEVEPNHPLKSFSYPYCVMSLEVFESAVEIASANDRSLHQILIKYWEDSGDLEISTPSADCFEPWKKPTGDLFSESYWSPFRHHEKMSDCSPEG